MNLSLTPATEADREFLYELHRATMREHIERTWGWDEEWQRADLERRFRAGTTQIITVSGKRAGAIELAENDHELVVANIQIVPAHQGHGIGTRVLEMMIARASEQGRDVGLQVLVTNTGARRLYERLGFVVTENIPPHLRMTRSTRLTSS